MAFKQKQTTAHLITKYARQYLAALSKAMMIPKSYFFITDCDTAAKFFNYQSMDVMVETNNSINYMQLDVKLDDISNNKPISEDGSGSVLSDLL